MRIFLLLTIFLFGSVMPLAAQTENDSAGGFFKRGTQLAQRGDYGAAFNFYRKALEISENSGRSSAQFQAKVHYNLGVCLFQKGEKTKSVAEFSRAVEFDKNYAAAFYALGLAQSELENYAAAKTAFLRVLEITGECHGEAWFDLAFVYLAEKDFDRAAASFAQAVRFGSRDAPMAHNNLGVIFALKHDFIAAEKEFKTAWKASRERLILAKNNLGFIRQYQQNKNQALLAEIVFGTKNQMSEETKN